MFGLTFEKLLLVGLIAAVVIGPQRLPGVVARLAALLGGLRRTVESARQRAAVELGVPADAAEWRALDPRRYDPRRIIAEALAAPPVAASAPITGIGAGTIDTDPIATRVPDAAPATPAFLDAAPAVPMRRIRVGTSSHPRWIEVPVETSADPGAGDPARDDATVRTPVTA